MEALGNSGRDTMVNRQLALNQYQEGFAQLMAKVKISSPRHSGSHWACYSKASAWPEYELSAYVLDCTGCMPDVVAVAALPDWAGLALMSRHAQVRFVRRRRRLARLA